MEIYEPDESQYEQEHRYLFVAGIPPGPHVIVQGSVGTEIRGHSDRADALYEVRLNVGPFWKDVDAVVPSVTINGFWNPNADEDDQELWEIKDLHCGALSKLPKKEDESRLRLRFTVRVKGEASRIIRLGYYLVASGQLGEGGLDAPRGIRPLE